MVSASKKQVFQRGKTTLRINVIQIREKGKCIGRKVRVCRLLVVKKTRCFIRLDRWHRQKPRNDYLTFIRTYIFLYRDDTVTPFSNVINQLAAAL